MPYFKYLSPLRIDVLENLKVRYTQVSALNDPFECLPEVVSRDGDRAKEERFQQKIRSITETTLGVFSLSKTSTNILMWSHYAACHTGFVLEFDSKHPYFEWGTEDVIYSYVRPRMFAVSGDQATKLTVTKSMDWKYEREVRRYERLHDRVHPLPNGNSIIEGDAGAKEDPAIVHLKDIPKNLITGVIIGWKSSEMLVGQIRKALK